LRFTAPAWHIRQDLLPIYIIRENFWTQITADRRRFLSIFLSAVINANLRPNSWLWLCYFIQYATLVANHPKTWKKYPFPFVPSSLRAFVVTPPQPNPIKKTK
jgi:hypothetical protein